MMFCCTERYHGFAQTRSGIFRQVGINRGCAMRVIFHLDMDAFYASVEQRDNPGLRGKALIVGAPPTQPGVVCAASYEARKFGVQTAMPSYVAKRLCPHGVFIMPRMQRYREESAHIMRLITMPEAVVEQ